MKNSSNEAAESSSGNNDLEKGKIRGDVIAFTNPPVTYCCPITLELMVDPVIAEDGITYDRDAITQCFTAKGEGRSPITRQPISMSGLRINYAIKNLIEDWARQNPNNELVIEWNNKRAAKEASRASAAPKADRAATPPAEEVNHALAIPCAARFEPNENQVAVIEPVRALAARESRYSYGSNVMYACVGISFGLLLALVLNLIPEEDTPGYNRRGGWLGLPLVAGFILALARHIKQSCNENYDAIPEEHLPLQEERRSPAP